MKTSAPRKASARVALLPVRVGDVRQFFLDGVHALAAALVDDAVGVAHRDVLRPGLDQQLGHRNGRGPGAVEDDLDLVHLPAGDLQGIEQGGQAHHRGAVLVVVKDRDIQPFAQSSLDFEAPGRGDVLQVNAGKNRRDVFHHLHDPVGLLGADADGKGLHPAEGLKQDGLAFHHRQRRPGADIPQTQDRAAIGDDGHQVVLAGIVIGGHGVLEDLGADLGHGCRGIQPPINDLVLDGHLGVNLDAPLVAAVQLQGLFIDTQLPVVLAFRGQPGQLPFVNIAFGALVNPFRSDDLAGHLGHPGFLGRPGHRLGNDRGDVPVHLPGNDVVGATACLPESCPPGPGPRPGTSRC